MKRFEIVAVKLLAKETKWTSLEARTHPTFPETLISKYDFGPGKLSGLSRNGPLLLFKKHPSIPGLSGKKTGPFYENWISKRFTR